MANNLIIKKSNRFVEGIYDVDLWEMRVILIMLSLIKREDKDFQEYRIDLLLLSINSIAIFVQGF